MFCKKVVFKNFVKLTGKTCWCCYFCRPATLLKKRLRHILKIFFFIEHLRWLLLPTLKPLDSLKQLCKWISKLVTVYFISTFLVLVGIFMFIFGEHKLSFYISIVLWLCSYDVFDFFTWLFGWGPISWFSTLPSFGGHEPCKCGHKTFFFHVTTWLMRHVTLWVGSPHPKLPSC